MNRFIELLLKFRDKAWFITSAKFNNTNIDDNNVSYRLRFSFFLYPIAMFVNIVILNIWYLFNSTAVIDPNNYAVVLPIVVVNFVIWRWLFFKIENYLGVYPKNELNNSGEYKNGFFLISITFVLFGIVLGTIKMLCVLATSVSVCLYTCGC